MRGDKLASDIKAHYLFACFVTVLLKSLNNLAVGRDEMEDADVIDRRYMIKSNMAVSLCLKCF